MTCKREACDHYDVDATTYCSAGCVKRHAVEQEQEAARVYADFRDLLRGGGDCDLC